MIFRRGNGGAEAPESVTDSWQAVCRNTDKAVSDSAVGNDPLVRSTRFPRVPVAAQPGRYDASILTSIGEAADADRLKRDSVRTILDAFGQSEVPFDSVGLQIADERRPLSARNINAIGIVVAEHEILGRQYAPRITAAVDITRTDFDGLAPDLQQQVVGVTALVAQRASSLAEVRLQRTWW